MIPIWMNLGHGWTDLASIPPKIVRVLWRAIVAAVIGGESVTSAVAIGRGTIAANISQGATGSARIVGQSVGHAIIKDPEVLPGG